MMEIVNFYSMFHEEFRLHVIFFMTTGAFHKFYRLWLVKVVPMMPKEEVMLLLVHSRLTLQGADISIASILASFLNEILDLK